jgi:hypothetical protein
MNQENTGTKTTNLACTLPESYPDNIPPAGEAIS